MSQDTKHFLHREPEGRLRVVEDLPDGTLVCPIRHWHGLLENTYRHRGYWLTYTRRGALKLRDDFK